MKPPRTRSPEASRPATAARDKHPSLAAELDAVTAMLGQPDARAQQAHAAGPHGDAGRPVFTRKKGA